MTSNEIRNKLHRFTTREDTLMERLAEMHVDLTTQERLFNWRLWIQDSEIYLNELSNFVEDQEKRWNRINN